jgi:hypothetical protein
MQHGHMNIKKWVTTLSDPMQVGLMEQSPSYGSPVPCIKSQIAPSETSDIFRAQEKGIQASVSKGRHSFALTKNVGWRFPRRGAPLVQRTVNQPRYVETPSLRAKLFLRNFT